MKLNKQIIVALVIMIATSALYRVLPGRPYGFAPQIAIALFGGSLFATKKQYAFLLPILSMFISDVLYQVLFQLHLSPMQGFYEGQLLNYVLIAGTAVFGFGLQRNQFSKYITGLFSRRAMYANANPPIGATIIEYVTTIATHMFKRTNAQIPNAFPHELKSIPTLSFQSIVKVCKKSFR